MRRVLPFLVVLLAFSAVTAADFDPQDMRLLRNPDIHGDRVVFVHGGNLWVVTSEGGEARRLTSHVGVESQPKFSPDGEWIAFSGSYDGNNDVYVIPSSGGEPRRLTWHPMPDRVIDWEPDGKSVRFQSSRESFTFREGNLWTVSIEGGMPQSLGLPTGGLSSWNSDRTKLAYNRITRENRTWKRYKGGMAQNVWVYDFTADTTTQITDWPGSENFPMWSGQKIYFTSDRTKRLQIWSYDTVSGDFKQLTNHKDFDVKWPSLGDGTIIYENGGWLYVLDLATDKSQKLTIALHDDRIGARPHIVSAARRIGNADLAPDAKRAVFSARGELFTVPAEKGDIRNISGTPGVHERRPAWSPDGKWVAYFSDASGEYELHVRRGDGEGEERQVTKGSDTYYVGLQWSPDSKSILTYDAARILRLVDLESGKSHKIDQDPTGRQFDVSWSPDSRWVAYAIGEPNGFRSVFLYDTDAEKATRATAGFTDDHSVAFDPDGKYLYFASSRHFNPRIGGYDLKPLWTEQDGLYLIVLAADGEHPFAPESDEVSFEEDEDEDEDEDAEKDAKKDDDEDEGEKDDDGDKDDADKDDEDEVEATVIDLDGIGHRIVALDVEAGNYFSLEAASGKLFYISAPAEADDASLHLFDMEERESKDVLGSCNGYTLSHDGKSLLYTANRTWGIVSAAADQKPAKKPLRIDEMRAKSVPAEEWEQIFIDAWRLEGDYFYDPGMHGVDWESLRDNYGKLVPYVSDRRDLDYILGELISELGTGHSYVRGSAEAPRPESVGTGLLGCDFVLDSDSGRYRMVNILTERDWNRNASTPLYGPGLKVAEGDFLLSVDGVALQAPTNPYSLFEDKVDRQVVLEISDSPRGEPSKVTVQPVGLDIDLRYTAWVEGNRRKVAEMSGGRFGYIHLPNTAIAGVQEFAKAYYPQLRLEGLVIDERYNGGGFIPDFLMHILRAEFVNMWKPRYGQDWRSPGTAFNGPMVMVSNAHAGSGGDALPYYFKHYKLGKVVGMRTWGGLVGIATNVPLMDGGSVTFPEFGLYNLDGEWDVENHGVDPDIEVDNLPHLVRQGRDPQLEKAVEVLLQDVKDRKDLPSAPRFPRDR